MATGRRFLLAFNDTLYQEAMMAQLSGLPETAATVVAADEDDATTKVKKDFFDAVIIDDMPNLPEKLRNVGYTGSVVVLGSEGSEPDDYVNISDFVVKPFRITNFVARLYQSILNLENKDKKDFTVGFFNFNAKSRQITSNKTKVAYQLTEKEADILTYLYRMDGKIVDREVLLREIWGYNADVTTHTLETHIYRLRQKIDTDTNIQLIVAENGGYRINKITDRAT